MTSFQKKRPITWNYTIRNLTQIFFFAEYTHFIHGIISVFLGWEISWQRKQYFAHMGKKLKQKILICVAYWICWEFSRKYKMGILACKSVLTTEKGWLFASSRMFVKGDSNTRASGGVSEKYRALSISAKLLVHLYKNMPCIYLEGHLSSVEECKSRVGTTHRGIIARRLSGVQKYVIIFDLYLDKQYVLLHYF